MRRAPVCNCLSALAMPSSYLMPTFGSRPVEQFGILLLDTKHRVLRVTIVASGGMLNSDRRRTTRRLSRGAPCRRRRGRRSSTTIHPAIPARARKTWPLPERLRAAGMLMGIDVVDHVVLGDGRY